MINELDQTVGESRDALLQQEILSPDVLFLLGTGMGNWLQTLDIVSRIPLPHAPPPWTEETLTVARMGALTVWVLEDLGDDPRYPANPAWRGGFPIWLAAKCGASVVVHTSAGSILEPDSAELVTGGFAVAADHLNLSGRTPLTALGESQLGPLFPDQSLLHHRGLRAAVIEQAKALSLPLGEALVACTAGPSLETDAERGWYRSVGADVAVQALTTPVHAAAHAGLAGLFLVALTDAGERPVRVQTLAEVAERAQPALASLLTAILPAVETAVANITKEGSA